MSTPEYEARREAALAAGAHHSLANTVRRFSHGSRVPGWDDAVDLDKDPAAIPDPATTPVPEELRATIEGYMARYPDRRSASLPALAAAQRVHGWCSPEAIDQVACVMRLTPGYLVALSTFYDMFKNEPFGRHEVYVCTNISCSLRGADEVYAAMLEAAADDPDVHVVSFECLGACDIAPMASVDGVYVGPLSTEDPRTIVEDLAAGRVLALLRLVRALLRGFAERRILVADVVLLLGPERPRLAVGVDGVVPGLVVEVAVAEAHVRQREVGARIARRLGTRGSIQSRLQFGDRLGEQVASGVGGAEVVVRQVPVERIEADAGACPGGGPVEVAGRETGAHRRGEGDVDAGADREDPERDDEQHREQ